MHKFLKSNWIAIPLGIMILLGFFKIALAQSSQRTDNLVSQPWWQQKVTAQASAGQNHRYTACLFGDSITSPLGDTLGDGVANFAIGGLSTISLLEQLKTLQAAQVQCPVAVIAIGTNDAWYATTDETFVRNLTEVIQRVRDMGATQIILLPAFYSTLSASFDPALAGPIQRVDEINVLMQQVANDQQVTLLSNVTRPLFHDHSLRMEYTVDGVHLNDAGKTLYRQMLRQILQSVVP